MIDYINQRMLELIPVLAEALDGNERYLVGDTIVDELLDFAAYLRLKQKVDAPPES